MRPPALVHAPLGNDAEALADQVERTGEKAVICPTVRSLEAALEAHGPEAALLCLVSQEGAGPETGAVLGRAFAYEPSWSRLPLIFLVSSVARPPPAVRALDRKEHAPPFLVLERPCRPDILRHAIETQAEGRRRQFDTRGLLERLHGEEERSRFLLDELRHRTRNSLAVLQALFSMSVRRAGTVEELAASFGARLHSLSEAHTRLSGEGDAERPLDTLLSEHVVPYAHSEAQVSLCGPATIVHGQMSFDLAMVVHELATNAAKYGALSRPEGRVEVAWDPEPETGSLRLVWREMGGPTVTPPEETGLGSQVVRRFPSRRPSAEVRFESEGLVWTALLPKGTFRTA